jgi:type IV secretion system protein TrbG
MTLNSKRTASAPGYPLATLGLMLAAGTTATVLASAPTEPPTASATPNAPPTPSADQTLGLPPGVPRAIPGRAHLIPIADTPAGVSLPAQRAPTESHAEAENPNAMPTRDNGGRVIFVFGESVPTLVCAPLHVCDMELQPGESVRGAPHIGDAVRWKISPALSGADDRKTSHLIIKPTQAGLDTNLVVPTDRHTYHLRLVSSFDRYVSSVAFFYPEEGVQTWNEFDQSVASGAARMATVSTAGGRDNPTVPVNHLNFDYRITVVKGKPRFKPLRAMDDGYRTYIAMNEDLPRGRAPALIAISRSGAEQMINYRLKGNIYVIDGIAHELALISGAGRGQQRVELQRHTCQERGWLGICWDPPR